MLLASVVQLIRIIFQESLAEAINAPEGRTQVVGNGIAERFEFLIERGKLRIRPRQFVSLVLQRLLSFFAFRDITDGAGH